MLRNSLLVAVVNSEQTFSFPEGVCFQILRACVSSLCLPPKEGWSIILETFWLCTKHNLQALIPSPYSELLLAQTIYEWSNWKKTSMCNTAEFTSAPISQYLCHSLCYCFCSFCLNHLFGTLCLALKMNPLAVHCKAAWGFNVIKLK